MRALLLVVAVAGCYRESSPRESVTNTTDPALLAVDSSCRGGDDLDHPVHDVFPEGRLRTHSTGVLSGAGARQWQGLKLPESIPLTVDGTLELFLADHTATGFFIFYREPYNVGSCTLGSKKNCGYAAAHYTTDGTHEWSLPLTNLLSRPDGIEIQDIRYSRGVLYFNEACQSYSSEAGGQCSSLVAVDPVANKVLWRTPSLVSNGRFAVRGCYIIAGYGFTSEPDNVFLVDKSTGNIAQKIAVSSAPQGYKLGKERLDVRLYAGVTRRYKLDGIETRSGRLVDLDPPEPMYGGAGYGGHSYGGHGYGGASYGNLPRRNYGGSRHRHP